MKAKEQKAHDEILQAKWDCEIYRAQITGKKNQWDKLLSTKVNQKKEEALRLD